MQIFKKTPRLKEFEIIFSTKAGYDLGWSEVFDDPFPPMSTTVKALSFEDALVRGCRLYFSEMQSQLVGLSRDEFIKYIPIYLDIFEIDGKKGMFRFEEPMGKPAK